MKSFKMKQLSMAVATAAVLAGGIGQASADALLFPYFQVGNGVYTFLSLHTDDATNAAFNPANAPNVHYIWNYKADPTSASSSCIHEDRRGVMTQFDLQQQTVEDPSLGVHLNLPAIFGDHSTANYLKTVPATGFIIVSDGSFEAGNRGQAIIVDTATGTLAAYKGLNNPFSTAEGNFYSNGTTAAVPTIPFSFTSKQSFDMTWYPTTETGSTLGAAGVDTSWNVLVTGGPNVAAFTAAGVADALAVSSTGMDIISSGWGSTGWDGAVTLNAGFNGVFNRDEVYTSGNQPYNIVCQATIRRANIMNNGLQVDTVNGGYNWATATLRRNNLSTVTSTPINATGMLMTKIETTTALGARKTFVSAENAFPNLPY